MLPSQSAGSSGVDRPCMVLCAYSYGVVADFHRASRHLADGLRLWPDTQHVRSGNQALHHAEHAHTLQNSQEFHRRHHHAPASIRRGVSCLGAVPHKTSNAPDPRKLAYSSASTRTTVRADKERELAEIGSESARRNRRNGLLFNSPSEVEPSPTTYLAGLLTCTSTSLGCLPRKLLPVAFVPIARLSVLTVTG